MCRNIERLFNLDPCVTEDEIHAAALQFVRKISGATSPRRPMRWRSLLLSTASPTHPVVCSARCRRARHHCGALSGLRRRVRVLLSGFPRDGCRSYASQSAASD